MVEYYVVSTTMQNELGLHIRPSTKLRKIAAGYKGEVRLRKGHREIDAKNAIEILTLGVLYQEEVTIIVSKDHPDYEDVVMRIKKEVFERTFEEVNAEDESASKRTDNNLEQIVQRFIDDLYATKKVQVMERCIDELETRRLHDHWWTIATQGDHKTDPGDQPSPVYREELCTRVVPDTERIKAAMDELYKLRNSYNIVPALDSVLKARGANWLDQTTPIVIQMLIRLGDRQGASVITEYIRQYRQGLTSAELVMCIAALGQLATGEDKKSIALLKGYARFWNYAKPGYEAAKAALEQIASRSH